MHLDLVMKKHEPEIYNVLPPYLTITLRPSGKTTKTTETPSQPPCSISNNIYSFIYFVLLPKKHRTTTTDNTQNMLTQNCQAYFNVTTKHFYETMPACGLIFANLKPQSTAAIQK